MSIENNIVDNSKQMMTTFTIKLSKYDNNTLGDLIKYIRPNIRSKTKLNLNTSV